MIRQHLTFACEGAMLVGTIDKPEGGVLGATTGLFIVSGGNETRAGAWNGQARLAARLAGAGHAVLRFDRRGVGDSEGENREFRNSAPDIGAAIEAFRTACPGLARIVGMGNCDAASALMLGGGFGLDALVLSNPWTIDAQESDEEAQAQVLRDHYRRRLADPAAIRRLLRGQVPIRALARSLVAMARPASAPAGPEGLAAEIAAGIADYTGDIRFLLAGRDRTALTFAAKWDKRDARIRTCPDATHSYVEPEAFAWLEAQVLEVLEGQRAKTTRRP